MTCFRRCSLQSNYKRKAKAIGEQLFAMPSHENCPTPTFTENRSGYATPLAPKVFFPAYQNQKKTGFRSTES